MEFYKLYNHVLLPVILENSRMVVTGDQSQVDLPIGVKSKV